jgi:hypothetical protein
MKRVVGFLTIAALSVVLSATVVSAKQKADATIKLTGGSVAAGVGLSWGSGTLTYKGKTYPIDVKGLSVGDVGVSKISASGTVYNLHSLDDFDGNYTAVGAGLTVAGGGSVATMQNQNKVKINLVSTTKGVKISLGGGGVDMKVKQ